ncbi:response regulator [Dyadobacter crusticola]|uniref:response regulator n=1 Tax=Dyadobacter crusticola TaxID=292407 RepID=UPI0004E0EAFF|nr:response regulator [Dyadobacter crusticola]
MSREIKVLLIDDDPVVLFLHKTLLKKAGITANVHTLNNGRDAIEFMDSCEPETAYYALLDINMPVMNGWEFLETLQTRPYSEQTSILLVSSATESRVAMPGTAYSQVIGFLSKPLTRENCTRILADLSGKF